MNALEPEVGLAPLVGTVVEGSAAEAAGVEAGDRVVEIAGSAIESWQDMVAALETRPGEGVPLVVDRDGERVDLTITPEVERFAGGVTAGRIGVGRSGSLADAFPREHLGLGAAIVHGAEETWRFTVLILEFLGGLLTGNASARDVGGPILIYQISEQVVQVGLDAYLNFMALFSINLAILNLLPIPILDGGQLLFLAVEGIRGRALSIEQRIRLSQVGLVLVVAIMVWALANDVLRLFGI
ncbi:MAG: RIP metalloprotease RseP [Gemmatimonadota bacterium]